MKRTVLLLLATPVALLGACSAFLSPSPEQLLNEGLTLSAENRNEEALSKFREATLTPARAAAWNNVGVSLAKTGLNEAAVKAYTQSLAHQPDLAVARFNRGTALMRIGRYADAATDLRLALDSLRRFPKAWNNLGISLLKLRRYTEATSAFRKAIALDRETARTWNNLGVAMLKQGKRPQAARAFRKALSLQSDHRIAQKNLRRATR